MNKIVLIAILTLLASSAPPLMGQKVQIVRGDDISTRNGNLTMDLNISDASLASFIGEDAEDLSGYSVSSAGDVNGDGYDDILIGAPDNRYDSPDGGHTYLIFGKGTGWSMDTDLSTANASFIGENSFDYSGYSASGAGDVNGDGYDDILIGAYANDDGGSQAGKTYLIMGKPKGWLMDTDLSTADATFIGEGADDNSGNSVSGAGDVNGDGYDDILIGAPANDDGAPLAGQTYLILGKGTGWLMDTDLSTVDATFIGEDEDDYSGYSVSGAGDVNGDGYDDILIGAPANDDGAPLAGQTYLILGKGTGWSRYKDLSTADASFIGENEGDVSGNSVSGAGDVNGDGYDDILIGALRNEEGGFDQSGQTYLIMGKATGWSMDTVLSNVDASFIGEAGESSGISVSGAGDVNGDGYDDILIGAWGNDEGGSGSGKTYMIFGKPTGWSMDTYLSAADASFIGENRLDGLGFSVSGAGDVNCDGYDDILIGADRDSDGGSHAGQTYLVPGERYLEPLEIYDIKVINGKGDEISAADIGETVQVEMSGLDSNETRIDRAGVNITFSKSDPSQLMITLFETGINTGIYKGTYQIPKRSVYLENLTFSPYIDQTKKVVVQIIKPLILIPADIPTDILEDTQINITFRNTGYNEATTWTFETNANWIQFDSISHSVTGLPDNTHVGDWWMLINITDGIGHYMEKNYQFSVVNTDPRIFTDNIFSVYQDQYYYVDYSSDDEGLGNTQWYIFPSYIDWLDFDSITGILNGTPTNDDVGIYSIHISLADGNGGSNWTEFTLTVLDRNDPPIIFTTDITEIDEGNPYERRYEALEIDAGDSFHWEFSTNASFLEFDLDEGILSGTPMNDDVGTWFVNVTAVDERDGMDVHNFTLIVTNVNDKPKWVDVPSDSEIMFGKTFGFDVNATDVDKGDILKYSIDTVPDVGVEIDTRTGSMEWYASFIPASSKIRITIHVTDGETTIHHEFTLEVLPSTPSVVNIISPLNGERVSAVEIRLVWVGNDVEGDPITYDVYLHEEMTFVYQKKPECRILDDFKGTSYNLSDPQEGKTYYWTVIPNDLCSDGICDDGVISFRINNIPQVSDINKQYAIIGEDFTVQVRATDEDLDDRTNLRYILIEAPEGMEINEETGHIEWTPVTDQNGDHTVILSVSDGIDVILYTFEIEVIEKESSNDKGIFFIIMIGIALSLLLLAAAIMIIIFSYIRKKRMEPGSIKREDSGLPQEPIHSDESIFPDNDGLSDK